MFLEIMALTTYVSGENTNTVTFLVTMTPYISRDNDTNTLY